MVSFLIDSLHIRVRGTTPTKRESITDRYFWETPALNRGCSQTCRNWAILAFLLEALANSKFTNHKVVPLLTGKGSQTALQTKVIKKEEFSEKREKTIQ